MELVDKKNIRWQFFPQDKDVQNILFILKTMDSTYFDRYKYKNIIFDGGVIKKTNARKDTRGNYYEFYFNEQNHQRQLLGKLEIKFQSISSANTASTFDILVENLELTESKIFILPNEEEDIYYVMSEIKNKSRSDASPIVAQNLEPPDLKITFPKVIKDIEKVNRQTHYPNLTMELLNIQPMTAPPGAIFVANVEDWTYTSEKVGVATKLTPISLEMTPIYVMGNATKINNTGAT